MCLIMLSRLNIRRIIPSSFQIVKSAVTTNIRLCFKHHVTRTTYGPPFRFPNVEIRRLYTVQTEKEPEKHSVDYDYVKRAASNASTLIIDVREPDEVKEHGKIPNSVNIPLGSVSPALGLMTDKEFEDAYNVPKPTEDNELIFYCMIGKRSAKAQQNALNLGYKNAKNYSGSWNDWASKIQK
ncbi:putative thiosulfate sulfurtransferase, mitochondrial [Trichoplusia ni]|uniref:Thiosulfate sulfurtransferase, mitochondrial n=1 Tax=Trichoplusia ni TaxID=7111 RepID=A0A7E5W9V7_TRINI|nr:putative thiosulfate sulfurtransferase, mitochondrial [Trichoplusia ni]